MERHSSAIPSVLSPPSVIRSLQTCASNRLLGPILLTARLFVHLFRTAVQAVLIRLFHPQKGIFVCMFDLEVSEANGEIVLPTLFGFHAKNLLIIIGAP